MAAAIRRCDRCLPIVAEQLVLAPGCRFPSWKQNAYTGKGCVMMHIARYLTVKRYKRLQGNVTSFANRKIPKAH